MRDTLNSFACLLPRLSCSVPTILTDPPTEHLRPDHLCMSPGWKNNGSIHSLCVAF